MGTGFYLYLIFGFLSGVPAGMGMGGGTLLIPLLVLFGGVEQRIAQSSNLLAFLPMSGVALREHKKNGLLRTQGLIFTVIPAFVFSAFGSLVSFVLPAEILRKFFGIFLLCLSVITTKNAIQKN